ncbi:hypothetical protein [Pandoraea pnomenusa]|uniref:hypothetical protein n=1 Tax=Pandoraea pnomenusa TaxID=93220 RepID=UPI003342306E
MKEVSFDRLAREYFGEVLRPMGFSCAESKFSNFYRQVSNDIVHVVMPDLMRGGTRYEVRVFATSSKIEPQFVERFPDDIGIPSGTLSYLHPVMGVGPGQKLFHCKTEEGFIRGFLSEVAPALSTKALPYLEKISTLESLIPEIRHDFYLGMAMWHAGDRDPAQVVLRREAARLAAIPDETGRTTALIKSIQALLNGAE